MMWILATIVALNVVCYWFKDKHELGFKRVTRFGRFDGQLGIEAQEIRDFDLTLSFEPRWYITFQLSLWSVYTGFSWSRDPGTDFVCDFGDVCCQCDCPNKCGELGLLRIHLDAAPAYTLTVEQADNIKAILDAGYKGGDQ